MELHFSSGSINEDIIHALLSFIYNNDLNDEYVHLSKDFKNLVSVSFKAEKCYRPSATFLLSVLQKYGCKLPGGLTCKYSTQIEELSAFQSLYQRKDMLSYPVWPVQFGRR